MKKIIKNEFLGKIGTFILGFILCAGIQMVSAWQEPTSTPPEGNVAGPLTTGSGDQTKAGGNISLDNEGSLYAGERVAAPQLCIGGDCRNSWPTASILSDSVFTNHIKDGTIIANDVSRDSVQVRVTGECSVGSCISKINNDGSVVCEKLQ